MFIQFIENKNTDSIIVSSVMNNSVDFYINSILSIILASKIIKNKINLKKHICFDISLLQDKFVYAFIYRILQGLYTFNKYITHNKSSTLLNISFYAPQLSYKDKKHFLNLLDNANYARNIINEPSNKSTPAIFANNVAKLFKKNKNIKVKIFDSQKIKSTKLGLIDAIGNSSNNPARFIIVDYKPKNFKKTICLVGKGVTIDTGGYSLKTKNGLKNMHMDKTGASISITLIKALSENGYKNRIIGLCPLVENIVSNNSIKPGDIVQAYNGQTVEIVDVDAEGRLILADALAYACKNYKPDYIYDFATLTGWSSRLHCHSSFTYFTLNDLLAKKIENDCIKYAERCFRIPSWTDYLYYIKSSVADVKNYNSECNSDGLMASMFLMNFIPNKYRKKWIHFDIRLESYNNNVNIADGLATFYDMILSQQ